MSNFVTITPGEISTKDLHQHLLAAVAPRPIAFASTIDREGNRNLAPFSFFNVFSAKPPILIFSPARRVRNNTTKHTLENVYEVPEVVINVVNYDIVEQMSLASTEYGEEVDEFVKAALTPIPSETVSPFRVKESPVQMECKITEIKPLDTVGGAGQLIFAQVLRMHINQEILSEDDMIDPHKIDLVARMGKNYYSRASGEAVFEVEKPLTTLGIGIDKLPEHVKNSDLLTGNDLGKLGNIENLPSSEEVKNFMDSEIELLSELTSKDDYHKKAKTLLSENRKKDALLVLLASQLVRS